MAVKFYNSTAAGGATGVDWTNAYTSLATAAAALAAGDTLWVGDNSAESVAGAITATFPGTVASPCFVYCVDHTQASPGTGDLKTTATVTATGANTITINGFLYCYGITFSAGSGATAQNLKLCGTNGNSQKYEACKFINPGTSGGTIQPANGVGFCHWVNCTVKFGATSQNISGAASSTFLWQNTASAVDVTGSLPATALFGQAGFCNITCEAVDFSALSAKTIFANSNANSTRGILKDCKLPASVTIAAAQLGGYGIGRYDLIRCDSSGTNYRQERHDTIGDLTTETTIVRTGGATDGTTPIAHKIVTNANAKPITPFESIPITFWNDSTLALTLSVFGIWGGGAVPNNDDIWIDVEYPGDASSGQGAFLSGTKANNLATGAAQTTDASTWGGSTTAFKMVSGSFTPAQKGPITIYVRAAKASTIFYIDPRPVISGLTISKSEIIAPGVYVNELSSGGAASSGVQGSRIRLGM